MNKFFNADNVVWRFVGNLADFFLLSILTILFSIPIFTAGAAMTALAYVTLKLSSGQEGKLSSQFFKSFRRNIRQITPVWTVILVIGIVLVIDLYYGLTMGTDYASAILIVSTICLVLYCCFLNMMLVLFARIDNTSIAIVKMSGAMVVRNFLPIVTTVIVMAAYLLFGIFIFWPILLFAPALPAYINAYIYNRILKQYGLDLKDADA